MIKSFPAFSGRQFRESSLPAAYLPTAGGPAAWHPCSTRRGAFPACSVRYLLLADSSKLTRAVALPLVPWAVTSQQPTVGNSSWVGSGPGRPALVGRKDALPLTLAPPSCRTVTVGGSLRRVQIPSFMKYFFPSQRTAWLHIPCVGAANQVSPEPTHAVPWPAMAAGSSAARWTESSHGSLLALSVTVGAQTRRDALIPQTAMARPAARGQRLANRYSHGPRADEHHRADTDRLHQTWGHCPRSIARRVREAEPRNGNDYRQGNGQGETVDET